MTDYEIVKNDLDALYIGNLNTVDADLTLPESGAGGSALTWTTSDARFISEEGVVGRPLFGMGNRKVWLTCSARLGEAAAERVFEATVLQQEKITNVTELLPVELEAPVGEKTELPAVVIARCEDGRYMTEPVTWGTGTTAEDGSLHFTGTVEGLALEARAVVTPVREKAPSKAPARRLEYIPMEQVRLTRGTEYYRFQQRMNEYLLSVDDDSMLYNFRAASGLDTQGAEPMTGWDAAECKLKGHTTGHYMSGLALAWAATGDIRFREKIDYMVAELAKCRDAFAAGGRTKPGYLGAYDETQFDLLEQYTKYPEIWAPYYTLEKIMSGLYDIYTLEGNPLALEVLTGLGDWTWNRLSVLPRQQLNKMWSMYIAGEFGGMIGIMTKLYRLTGKAEYLKTADLFYNDKLFYPMEQNVDSLEDMHGNQHVPQILGAMEIFMAEGEEKYWRIGRNFWEMVTGHHIYCVGGLGETEMFHGRDCECRYLTDKAAESCPSYNMLRLTGQIFPYSGDGRLMDYYENTLLNHIMTSACRDASGGTIYFLPLCPGGQKEYSTVENTCCHGTGMESRYRFMEHIYAEDAEYYYVNLYVDSELKDLLRLETTGEGQYTVTALQTLPKKLKLRIPDWAAQGFASTGFGYLENGYLTMMQPLEAGEEISVNLPMELRVLATSDENYVNLAEGPYILAAQNDSREFLTVQQAMKSLVRLNQVDLEPYHVYFRP